MKTWWFQTRAKCKTKSHRNVFPLLTHFFLMFHFFFHSASERLFPQLVFNFLFWEQPVLYVLLCTPKSQVDNEQLFQRTQIKVEFRSFSIVLKWAAFSKVSCNFTTKFTNKANFAVVIYGKRSTKSLLDQHYCKQWILIKWTVYD